jgi:feruloyl esterase
MEPEPGETYDPAAFDFDRDMPRIERLGTSFTPTPDLRAFAARRGKVILVHGWADQMVPPASTINYYQAAQAQLGEAGSNTVRLFMVPGMAHCGNPPGLEVPGFNTSDFDALTTLENWVERGVAPTAITAVKRSANGDPVLSRPLCMFPESAVYAGSGNRRDLANWSCRRSNP